jgi:hypothetical protein
MLSLNLRNAPSLELLGTGSENVASDKPWLEVKVTCNLIIMRLPSTSPEKYAVYYSSIQTNKRIISNSRSHYQIEVEKASFETVKIKARIWDSTIHPEF